MSTVRVAEFERKIEDELRKPADERNYELLTFWKSRLPAPTTQPGNYLHINVNSLLALFHRIFYISVFELLLMNFI
jgi:hypothetical protein